MCEVIWDQFNTIAFLVECSQSSETPSTLTLDQFYTVFTPLLTLASELLMDMMHKLQVIFNADLNTASCILIGLVFDVKISLCVAMEGV